MRKNKKRGMPKGWIDSRKVSGGTPSRRDPFDSIYRQYLRYQSMRQQIILAAKLEELSMIDAVFDNDPEQRTEAERIVAAAIEKARNYE